MSCCDSGVCWRGADTTTRRSKPKCRDCCVCWRRQTAINSLSSGFTTMRRFARTSLMTQRTCCIDIAQSSRSVRPGQTTDHLTSRSPLTADSLFAIARQYALLLHKSGNSLAMFSLQSWARHNSNVGHFDSTQRTITDAGVKRLSFRVHLLRLISSNYTWRHCLMSILTNRQLNNSLTSTPTVAAEKSGYKLTTG